MNPYILTPPKCRTSGWSSLIQTSMVRRDTSEGAIGEGQAQGAAT